MLLASVALVQTAAEEEVEGPAGEPLGPGELKMSYILGRYKQHKSKTLKIIYWICFFLFDLIWFIVHSCIVVVTMCAFVLLQVFIFIEISRTAHLLSRSSVPVVQH